MRFTVVGEVGRLRVEFKGRVQFSCPGLSKLVKEGIFYPPVWMAWGSWVTGGW